MRSNCHSSHYTKATRHDNTKNRNSHHSNIINYSVLVSSYKTCFNINSKFIRIKYKYHYFNRNVRVISKRNINITRAFTWPENRFLFMMWLWSKKQNAPLFTTFVVTCIHVPSLRYTRGLGWRMHCGVEVTESSTNKQHHPLHNFCVYMYIHIPYLHTRAGSGLRAWCMCCGCRL